MKAILSKLGFEKRTRRKGPTSHEDWIRTDAQGRFFKVTVDAPKAPFTRGLLKSMANQAGVKVDDFYKIYREL